MSTDLKPCPACDNPHPFQHMSYVSCTNKGCYVYGPYDDPDGASLLSIRRACDAVLAAAHHPSDLERDLRSEVEKLRADAVVTKENLSCTEVAAECLKTKVNLLRDLLRELLRDPLREANHGQ